MQICMGVCSGLSLWLLSLLLVYALFAVWCVVALVVVFCLNLYFFVIVVWML